MHWVLARARLWTGHQWDAADHPWVIPCICPGFLRREGLPRSASKRLRPATSDGEERLPGGGDCSQSVAIRIASGPPPSCLTGATPRIRPSSLTWEPRVGPAS